MKFTKLHSDSPDHAHDRGTFFSAQEIEEKNIWGQMGKSPQIRKFFVENFDELFEMAKKVREMTPQKREVNSPYLKVENVEEVEELKISNFRIGWKDDYFWENGRWEHFLNSRLSLDNDGNRIVV